MSSFSMVRRRAIAIAAVCTTALCLAFSIAPASQEVINASLSHREPGTFGSGKAPSSPATVDEQSRRAPDSEAPFVTLNVTTTESTLSIYVTWCDDSTLQSGTDTIRVNGVAVTHSYTSASKLYCGARAISEASQPLTPNVAYTVTASIRDNRNNRGVATQTVTFVPTHSVTVTPDSVAVVRGSYVSAVQSFTLRNTGNSTTGFSLTPNCPTPAFVSCSTPSSSIQLAPNQTASVNVTYLTAVGPASGTVGLQADATTAPSASSSGGTSVAVSAPPESFAIVDATTPGWTSLERSSCLAFQITPEIAAQCDAFRIVHPLPGVITRGKARAPTLIYYSDWIHGAGVAANVTVGAGMAIPDSAKLDLYRRNADSSLSYVASRSFAWGLSTGYGPARIAVPWAASSTGLARYRVQVQFRSGSGPWQSVGAVDGEFLEAFRRNTSHFGAGWWLAGIEQLVLRQGWAAAPTDQVAWIGGDGSLRKFVRRPSTQIFVASTAIGRPDSLIQNATALASDSAWVRLESNNVRVYFDSSGQHTRTVNRVGEITRFFWRSSGTFLLDSMRVPGNLTYRFAYDANGWLSSITAPPVGVQTRVVQVDRQIVASAPTPGIRKFTDPTGDSVTFTYDGWDPTAAIRTRTNREGVTTTINEEGWGPGLASATTFDGIQNVTHVFANAMNRAMAPGTSPVPLDSVYTRYTNPRNAETKFWVNALGAPTKIINALGQVTTIAYADPRFPALPTQLTQPGGLTSRMAYNARGLDSVHTVVNPLGESPARDAVTTYHWHPKWDLVTAVHSPEGSSDSTSYDNATGNRLWQQDGRGSVSRVIFGYDGENRLISVQAPGNTGSSLDRIYYDPVLGNVDSVKTPLGFATRAWHDGIGRDTLSETPIDTLQTLRQRQRTWYNIAGDVDSTVASGPAVTYTLPTPPGYSAWTSPVHANTLITRRAYDRERRLTSVYSYALPSDTLSDVLVNEFFAYDGLGRQVQHTKAHGGGTDSTTYDAAGNVVAFTRKASGFTVTSSYDALNRITRRTTPARSYGRMYCEGFPTGPTTGDSPATGCFEVYPAFPTADSSYAMPAQTDTFTYDPSTGYLLKADNPAAKIHRSYFPNGAIKTDTLEMDAQHRYVTSFQYDLDGRRTSVTAPSFGLLTGGTITYGYRPDNGALSTITDPRGGWSRFTYDAAGRVDSLVIGPSGGGKGIWETHTYDADGRQTRRIRYRSGSPPVLFDERFVLDAQGRVIKVERSSAANGMPSDTTRIVYSGLGAVAARMRVDQLAHWEAEEFRVDAFGNVRESRASSSDRGIQDVRYSQYRLRGGLGSRFTLNPVKEEERFNQAFDSDGNQVLHFQNIKQVFGPHTTNIQSRSYYDGANRLRATQTYNVVPNASSTGTFDEYSYDALGRRVVIVSHRSESIPACAGMMFCIPSMADPEGGPSSKTWTVWDGDHVLAEDKRGLSNGSTSPAAFGGVIYIDGGGMDQPIATLDQVAAGGVRIPHATWRGQYESSSLPDGTGADCTLSSGTCTYVAWNASGAVYQRPAPIAAGAATNVTYTWVGNLLMDQQDPSGLLYRRNRYYDPSSGHFTQQDPIGLAGGLNAYGFASGDPVNYADPFGLCPDPKDPRCTDQPLVEISSNRNIIKAGAAVASVGIFGRVMAAVVDFLAGKEPAASAPVTRPAPPNAKNILMPNGSPVGTAGSRPAIRELPGGEAEANAMFDQLSQGGSRVGGSYPGVRVSLPGGGTVGIRTVMSGNSPNTAATIDINIPGIPIDKIKFNP